MTLKLANSYAKLDEKDSEDVLQGKITDTLKVDTMSRHMRNVKGEVSLSPS